MTRPTGNAAGVCVFPCSFAQERLWFLDRLVPGSSSYNTDIAVRFPTPCDLEALRLALNEIVARHEVLRTTFVAVDGRPYQVIAEALVLDLPLIEIAGGDTGAAMQEARRIAAARSRWPSPLGALAIQYADYAVWQRQRLGEAEIAAEVAWWAETLAQLPTIELPCDHPALPSAPSPTRSLPSRSWSKSSSPSAT